MTRTEKRALELIKREGKLTGQEFAYYFWPDGFRTGGHPRAQTLAMVGGSYLTRLEKKGWVEKTYMDIKCGILRSVNYMTCSLTKKGEKVLSDA